MAAVVSALASAAACSGSDRQPIADLDASADTGGGADVVSDTPASEDASAADVTSDVTSHPDGDASDTTPPGFITLTASTAGVHAIKLDWTATGDDGNVGTASSYDIRWSTSPITNEQEFAAATAVTNAPNPAPAGSNQSHTVDGLPAGTTLHFAMRAKDEVPNAGPISNDFSAPTLPRAKLQISEIATANTAAEGSDFLELVALTTGRIDGLVVKESTSVLYSFSAVTVVAGERIVIHAGDPCGLADAGPQCAQEDVRNDKASSTEPFASPSVWDVYVGSGLNGSGSVIGLYDGNDVVDAVAISNRDGDASPTSMTAYAAAAAANAWTFPATPADGVNDCETQRAAASVATTDTPCGGYATAAKGVSLQRSGTTDTNAKKDFYAAPQTRGTANAPNAPPTLTSATAASATQVVVRFDEELDPATVVASAFTIAGLTVTAATLTNANEVTLTTSAQAEGGSYVVSVATSVTDLQGVALAAPTTVPLCGYSMGTSLQLSEIAPNVAGSLDLVELRVTRGGSTSGFVVRSNPTTTATSGNLLATLPAICAATNDVIVVHLGTTGTSETSSKTQSSALGTYATAWDVFSGSSSSSLAATDVVVTLLGGGALVDAVALSNQDGTSSGTFTTALGIVQAAGAWKPADCGGIACTDVSTPTAQSVAASMSGVGTDPNGNTVARTSSTDTDTAADWVVGAQTLGN